MPKPQKRSDKELRATAYHEAGHAVTTVALGLTIDKVSILPGDGYEGVCTKPGVAGYDMSDKRESRSIARRLILSTYAGMHAQRLVDPDAPDSHGYSDENDAFNISRLHGLVGRYCRMEGDEYHLAYLDRLRAEARRLVKRHQKVIEEFAELLLRRREIEREEAEQFIESLLGR